MWFFDPAAPTAEMTGSGLKMSDFESTDFCPAVPPMWTLTTNLIQPDQKTEFVYSQFAVGFTFDLSITGGTFELIGKTNYGTFDAFTTAAAIEARINEYHSLEFGADVYPLIVAGVWPAFTVHQPAAGSEPYGFPTWSIIDSMTRSPEPTLIFPGAHGTHFMQRDLRITVGTVITNEDYEILYNRFYRTTRAVAVWRAHRVESAQELEFAYGDEGYRWQLLYGVDYGLLTAGVWDPSSWSLIYGKYIGHPDFDEHFIAYFADVSPGIPSQFSGVHPWRFGSKTPSTASAGLFEEFPDAIDVFPAWW